VASVASSVASSIGRGVAIINVEVNRHGARNLEHHGSLFERQSDTSTCLLHLFVFVGGVDDIDHY
jgi:hypothetical protein